MPVAFEDVYEVAEDNIVARIESLVTDLDKVEGFGDEAAVKTYASSKRAAYVLFENETFEPNRLAGGEIFQNSRMTWQIFVTSDSMRGPKRARKGQRGTYRLARLVLRSLLGYDPINDSDTQAAYPIEAVSIQQFENTHEDRYIALVRVAHASDIATEV